MDLGYTLSGFAVGIVVGLTGVGGGSLMTPLLVLFFGVAPATAVGTDLLYASITKAGGAVVHARRQTVRWDIAGRLAAGSLPGALATLAVLSTVHVDPSLLGVLVTRSLAVALILTAPAIVLKDRIRQWARTAGRSTSATRADAPTVVAGFVLGVLVTLSSVGAGALGVVALFVLYPRLSSAETVGTDIAHAVPLTLVAGLGHAQLGTVDIGLLGSLLIGSLPGITFGSMLSSRVPEALLRSVLAAMLLLVGGRLVL